MSGTDSNKTTSTVQAIVDTATGAAKSVYGSVVRSSADHTDQREGQARRDNSDATAKAGSVTVSGSGGVATDSKDRTEGSWSQVIGSAKQALGGLVGSESVKQAGAKQYRDGKQQEATGRLDDLASGISARVVGATGATISGLTGNTPAKDAYEAQHDDGKARQRSVEKDLHKEEQASQ